MPRRSSCAWIAESARRDGSSTSKARCPPGPCLSGVAHVPGLLRHPSTRSAPPTPGEGAKGRTFSVRAHRPVTPSVWLPKLIRWTRRARSRGSLSPAPYRREPWLLAARFTFGAIVVSDLDEAGGSDVRLPGLERVKCAVAVARKTFAVRPSRIRAEQDAARLERASKLAEHARKLLGWHVEERGIREYSVKAPSG